MKKYSKQGRELLLFAALSGAAAIFLLIMGGVNVFVAFVVGFFLCLVFITAFSSFENVHAIEEEANDEPSI